MEVHRLDKDKPKYIKMKDVSNNYLFLNIPTNQKKWNQVLPGWGGFLTGAGRRAARGAERPTYYRSIK